MSSGIALRPVLAGLAGLLVSACGGFDSDPHRFENFAEQVAAIPVDGRPAAVPTPPTAAEAGLRPVHASDAPALQVVVMEPHDMWDARDGLRGMIDSAAPAIVEAAAPAVMQAAVDRVKAAPAEALRPAIQAASDAGTTIQLGAFSTRAAAEAAWARVSDGAARGLTPRFEPVRVNGRDFTRLKVGSVPVASAEALCRAAQVSDPWCAARA